MSRFCGRCSARAVSLPPSSYRCTFSSSGLRFPWDGFPLLVTNICMRWSQCKQINSGERQRDQRMQILVTRSGNPSQGKRKPEEEKVHRYDEGGKDTARAEQRPQNRLIRVLHHL